MKSMKESIAFGFSSLNGALYEYLVGDLSLI